MSAERNHRHLDLLVLRQLGVVLVQKGVCKNFGGVLGGLHLGGTPLPGPAAAGNLVIHGSGDVHDNHDVDWLAVLGLGRVADDGEGEVVGAISVGGADGLVVRRNLVGDVVRRQSRGRRESGHAEQSAKRYSEEYDPPPQLFSDLTKQLHATTPYVLLRVCSVYRTQPNFDRIHPVRRGYCRGASISEG